MDKKESSFDFDGGRDARGPALMLATAEGGPRLDIVLYICFTYSTHTSRGRDASNQGAKLH